MDIVNEGDVDGVADEISWEDIAQEIARGKNYFLVLLLRTGKPRMDEAELDRLQAEHLRHLLGLRRAGKLVVNGPILDGGVLRGISIYDAATQEEVQGYVKDDPLIQAGYLAAEIHPWMGMPGDGLR
jgi:uncharacterized protein YciI